MTEADKIEEEKKVKMTACSSNRLDFLFPEESRDEDVFALYNDKETMLPYLPQLCPISSEALKERRQRHRDEYLKGQSLFWDMVMPLKVKTDASVEAEAERETRRRTSLFVGTSGFRMINRQKGEVEWGIVISKQFQREGLCREAFRASVQYAREHLHGIVSLRASTLAMNQPMVNFLLSEGLEKKGSHKGDYLTTEEGEEEDDVEVWDDYVMPLL